ncbi:queuine tRNA-ribosyltransferase family protein [Myxococcota bacterium]|nr:queuine tRNA-ribosyltransferase family protein [Myxococcota bacterium]
MKIADFLKFKGTRYFIPDWDDRVDAGFDFVTEVSPNKGWEAESYAHELFPTPPYDGILVSKVVEEKSRQRRARLRQHGVHAALRVAPEFPVLGDCGAFGYLDEPVPPYSVGEILDYYTACGFDLGVSVDHLIPTADHPDRDLRYRITLENAAEFLKEHKRRGLDWIPVGAVQGWDPESYAQAANKTAEMGYRLLALGGLVRASTTEILAILDAVSAVLPRGTHLHLFGLSREALLPHLGAHHVASVDSASSLRQAWLSPDQNYHTADFNFCAVRVPQSEGRGRKKAGAPGQIAPERELLAALHAYDAAAAPTPADLDDLMRLLTAYTLHCTPDFPPRRIEKMRHTLAQRPWKACSCAICQGCGIDVAIFRGNNRNRRRGFHNTWVLYNRFLKLRSGK